MSQPRVRIGPGESEAGKNRVSVAKASGDTAPNSRTKEQNHKSNKKKIPKKIQYDLDNALVGVSRCLIYIS